MFIVDTNVLIAAIRDDDLAKKLLSKYANQGIYITIITEMELNIGATNTAKKQVVKKVITNHEVLHLNKGIGNIALALIKTYNNNKQVLYLGDALIAAFCLHHKYKLITFNSKDFKNIKGIQFAN
jgi:predicted nucleic acid-binding protein